ncbi:hypothetical protein BFP75_00890 [Maribacter sp. 4G9]|nr:hypothetical protein BFP75_00890 [Maribacter sp. 4G9]
MVLPEIFTLGKEDYIAMHDFWFRALRQLPVFSYVHKQDIFIKQLYDGENLPDNTFIQKATKRHFSGREYFLHFPLLFIGNRGKSFLKNPSLFNPFATLVKKDKLLAEFERDDTFKSEVSKCIDFLNNSKYIKAVPLTPDDLYLLQENYFNGFHSNTYYDSDLEDTSNGKNCISVGNKRIGAFSINKIKQFPEHIDIYKRDNDYSSKKFEFFKGLGDDFGFRIPHDHIYNQIIYLDNHHSKKEALKEQGRRLKGAEGFDTENKDAGEDVKKYLSELNRDEQKILVQGHTNIIYYASSDKEFDSCTNYIETLFKLHDFRPQYPKKEVLKELYINSFGGFSGSISKNRMYDTELQICTALFLNVTSYRNDDEGIVFSDRLYNIPVIRDVRDELKRRIKAWNFSIYAPTGEGKSVLAQHIFRQFNEFGYKSVIFDIGGSFKKLALLLPKETTLFFSFEPGKPLPLNSFNVADPLGIDTLKLKSLAEFVFKLWQPENDIEPDVETALIKILKTYYENVSKGFSFPSFYEFVRSNKDKLLAHLGIETRFFDADKFLFSCSRFVKDGAYAYLFNDIEDSSHLIDEKDYIVFEFDKAQDDPTALSILMLIGSEAVKKLIWEDKATPGIIFFDELAKFIKYKVIRDTVVFFYQAIRKQNASVGSALQSPSQLPIGEDTSAMIDNTQVLYILYNEKGYAPLVERYSLSEHQHTLLKSLTSINDMDTDKKFVEFALIIGRDIWILRIELPKEALKLYQTDGKEYEEIMQLYEEKRDMEKAILEHIETH